MSTLPAPPYTDDNPSLRRASIDSDSSIFSNFELTPESEADLRAWEETMLETPTPTPSKISPPGIIQSTRRWVVFKGRAPGVYHTP